MDEMAILDRLTDVFSETLDEPEIELKREATAEELEDWDSVSNIQLMVAVGQAFGLTLRTGEIAGLRNVGELMDVIAGRLAGLGRGTAGEGSLSPAARAAGYASG